MNITDVRVRKMMKESNLKAVASITIDDDFVVHDIKVVEGEKGLFIAMPSRKAADGENSIRPGVLPRSSARSPVSATRSPRVSSRRPTPGRAARPTTTPLNTRGGSSSDV